MRKYAHVFITHCHLRILRILRIPPADLGVAGGIGGLCRKTGCNLKGLASLSKWVGMVKIILFH